MKNLTTIGFLLVLVSMFTNSYTQTLENLGANVNSKLSETAPKITTDGKFLYFLRSEFKKEKIYQHLWVSEIGLNGNWGPAAKLNSPFNKGDANQIINISPDGNEIIFSEYYYKSNKGFLYIVNKIGNKWGVPKILKNVEDENQFENSKWGNACISSSGKIELISATSSKNSDFGEIYVSFKNDSLWSRAFKLKSPINIQEGQWGQHNPVLASDDVTLYFISDREGGYGGTDVYISKRLDDSWLNWSKPINLGNSINSKGYELFYTISARGDYAYLSSNINTTDREDIYRFKLQEEVKPNPVVLVSGKVLDPSNNQPLDANIYYFTLPDGIEVGIAKTNPSDGSFKIVLPYGKIYSYSAKANGYYSISNYLDLTTISEYKEVNSNIEMKPVEVGESFRLNNIFFDFNTATLRAESHQELERVVNLLNENPSIEIELSGHTDNVGSDEYNLDLSQQRADAVTSYLISKGIDVNRIVAKGYGESSPVTNNDSEEGRQVNRRVEFKILKK